MTVTLELSDDKAEKLADHLDKAYGSYRLMARDAREAGDKLAYSDFRAEAETAIDLRKRVIGKLKEGEDGGQ